MGTVESKTLFHQKVQTTPQTWKQHLKKKETRLLTFKPAKGFQVAAGRRNCWWPLFFSFFNTAALIQITWTTGVVCESPVFLWSVYCSHLVCGCVIESGPCLNKHQMWTQISCLLLYVLPVIYGKAPSCWSRCRAAVRPPLCRWYCLNCCAPYVIKTICPVFNYRTKTLYMTLNASFCLSIPWHYSRTQTFLYLKDRTTFFAGSQVTTCEETPRWEAVTVDEQVKHRTFTQENSVCVLCEIKVVVIVVLLHISWKAYRCRPTEQYLQEL